MKLRRYTVVPVCLLAATLIFSACNKDYTKDTPFDKGNTGTSSQNGDTNSGSENTGSEGTKPEGSATTPTTPASDTKPGDNNGSGQNVSEPENPQNITSTPEPTASPTESVPEITETPTPTEDAPTATPTPTEKPSRDSFNRQEYWQMTFLVWLPYFENGTFSGQNSEGTYDYATFSDITENDVSAYIDSLKKSGFTTDISEKREGGSIYFSAYNYNSWNATVSFTGSSLTIGSGFKDKESGDENLNKLYSTTMLQYIPIFNEGTFTGSDIKNDGTMYAYAYYSNVSSEAVISYIEKLKNAGYVYAIDENYDSGSTWFFALNEVSFECHVEYDGNTLKIGCGVCEDN